MTTFIITIGLLVILFTYYFISNKIKVKKHLDEVDKICLAHKKLKYPNIDKETQLRMMETGDFTPISEIVPEYKHHGTPLKLLKKYITISKEEFNEYLKQSGFIEKQKIENAPNPEHDGVWLMKDKIIDQEREYAHRTWYINNENEASDVYVNLLWEKIDAS